MTACEDCPRLEHELALTRDALSLCEAALAASQTKVDQLRLQLVRLQHVTGISGTLDARAIAERAGVGIMTFWKWKERYPDFPRPIPGTRQPLLYERTDVDAFLERHPRLGRPSPRRARTKRAGA